MSWRKGEGREGGGGGREEEEGGRRREGGGREGGGREEEGREEEGRRSLIIVCDDTCGIVEIFSMTPDSECFVYHTHTPTQL